jgi:hypothetical protein
MSKCTPTASLNHSYNIKILLFFIIFFSPSSARPPSSNQKLQDPFLLGEHPYLNRPWSKPSLFECTETPNQKHRPPPKLSPRDRGDRRPHWRRGNRSPQTKSFPDQRDQLRKLRSSGSFPDFEALTGEDGIIIRKLLAWLRKL